MKLEREIVIHFLRREVLVGNVLFYKRFILEPMSQGSGDSFNRIRQFCSGNFMRIQNLESYVLIQNAHMLVN